MHYLSHQSVDAAHGNVVDVAVTPGNAHDSEPYLERVEYMRSHLGLKIKAACADSAYGTSLIYRTVSDMGIRLYTPEATGGTTYKAATGTCSNCGRYGVKEALRHKKRVTI